MFGFQRLRNSGAPDVLLYQLQLLTHPTICVAGGISGERDHRAATGRLGQQGLGAAGGHQDTAQAQQQDSYPLTPVFRIHINSIRIRPKI